MDRVSQEIRSALARAEERLRELIAEAANAADYEGIDMARLVAGRLREIIDEAETVSAVNEKRSGAAVAASAGPRTRPTSARPVQRKKSRSKYPKFYVRNGVLHKVGWSKKDNAEYLHKIPKGPFDQIVRAIGELSHNPEELFTSEDVAHQLDAQGHSVPIYQVYLTLALLRKRKVVEKMGREGYQARADVVARGIRIWSDLESTAG